MTWPISEFSMTCDRSGVEHVVSVALPVRAGSLERAPLILCLDGPWMFGTVVDATRIMSMSGEAPEAMVVGLSFAESSMGELLRHRARWYTPTPYVPPTLTGVKGVEAEECGRAEILFDFLNEQLLPTVIDPEVLGGIEPSERWFAGHSFSGLFGLRALLLAPEMFDKWLLASPSIWWDDRAILDLEREVAATRTDLPARVFTCHGSEEDATPTSTPEVPPTVFNMGRNVEELVATLKGRGYPGLELSYQVLPGDAHSSSIGAAVSKGLRALL